MNVRVIALKRLVSFDFLRYSSARYTYAFNQISTASCYWHNNTSAAVFPKPAVLCTRRSLTPNCVSFIFNDSQRDEKSKAKRGVVFTIPNILTFSRMLATPVLGYLVLNQAYGLACCLFVVAGLTDVLDGWIARKVPGQTSALGSFLDPLADKMLVTVLFVSLSLVNLIPDILTAFVIGRDIYLIVAAFFIRYISLPPPVTFKTFFDLKNPTAQLHPTAISKFNTIMQLSLVACTLGAPVFGYVDHLFLHGLWAATFATTLLSGGHYLFAKNTFSLQDKRHR